MVFYRIYCISIGFLGCHLKHKQHLWRDIGVHRTDRRLDDPTWKIGGTWSFGGSRNCSKAEAIGTVWCTQGSCMLPRRWHVSIDQDTFLASSMVLRPVLPGTAPVHVGTRGVSPLTSCSSQAVSGRLRESLRAGRTPHCLNLQLTRITFFHDPLDVIK